MLKIYSYSIPFSTPFITAKDSYSVRNGLILTFENDGISAFGEIAPLPGFSDYSLNDIIPILQLNKSAIEKAFLEDDFDQFFYVLSQIHNIPSLKFGLDTLYHDYKAKKAGLGLADFLFKGSFQKSIAANATLSISESSDALEKATVLYNEGYRTFKIKVGADFNEEFEILSLLREKYPDVKLRIDANQSWTYKQAYSKLKQMELLDLEYCEEPLLHAEIDRLSELKKSLKINLAADESFRNKADASSLIQQNAVNTFILKPMMFGSFLEINVTKQLADSHYISVVLTTSIESIIGRTVTGILALGWGAEKYAHGLSTGSLLEYDIGVGNNIINGAFQAPSKPGIGIDLNYNSLKQII